MHLHSDLLVYCRDVFERSILLRDTLRQRADNMLARGRAGKPSLLDLDYEPLVDARRFEQPANDALHRITRFADNCLQDFFDPTKPPVITRARARPTLAREGTALPCPQTVFSKEWRKVARAAGIPDSIKSMQARAGAISKADDAGVELDNLRPTAAHSQTSTTLGYFRSTMGKSKLTARRRVAHRAAKNEA